MRIRVLSEIEPNSNIMKNVTYNTPDEKDTTPTIL